MYRFSTRLIHYAVVEFVYSLLYRMPRLVLMSLYSSIDGNRIVVATCHALVINCSFTIEHILIFSSILYSFIMPTMYFRKFESSFFANILQMNCLIGMVL